MRERSRSMCMWRPAVVVAALSMVVLSPAAFGQGDPVKKAWLDLRPLSGVSASGGHTVFGWCGDVDGGTACSSTADCAGDANGEQCYQTIELDSDNQEVYFEAWISNWASFANRTCFTPLPAPAVPDTGIPCPNGISDCSGPEICAGSILTYTVGLDCSGYENPLTFVLEVPQLGVQCTDAFVPLPPNGFCADVDTNDPDWIHANAVATIAGLNGATTCPQGEQADPWFPGGSVVSGGLGNDGTTNVEAYLATFAVKVPAGAKGTWTLFIEDDQDDPANVLVKHDAFLADDYFVDINTPLKIVLPVGRCCEKTAGNNAPFTLGCVDEVTLQECLAAGGTANNWDVGLLCSGVDLDPTDGIDDNCPACESNADCNDGDECTQDLCDVGAGECSNPDNIGLDRGVDCCSPTTGTLSVIDDGDQCTDDSCNQGTGEVTNALQVGQPCDDENDCSTADNCQADGSCGGTQVTGGGFTCPTGDPGTDNCPPETTSCDAGFCECSLCTPLTADVRNGQHADPNCHDEGLDVVVDINMGAGSQLATGAQWMINWDTSCLTLQGWTLGGAFPQPMFSDAGAGSLFVAQGIDVLGGQAGTTGPALLATVTFTKMGDCGTCNVCFVSVNPFNTILSNETGNAIEICPGSDCSKDIRLAGELSLEIPSNVFTNPDCDFPTAIVTFGNVLVSDTCDGAPTLDCFATHDGGLDVSGLLANGGEFPQGESIFECEATNNCGQVVVKLWTIDVSDQHTMDITVQLSPAMDDGPLTRCICFEFFADCVSPPVDWCDDMVFGGPFEWTGHSTNTVKVAKGQFACLTAKDPLHTLRSVSGIDCVGNVLVAEFKGDPALNGNWLQGGNLDCLKPGGGANTIDIRDFGVFVAEFAARAGGVDPNTPCGTASPHGDINGDGVVDTDDFDFISEHFLDVSKDACCPDGRSGPVDEPMASITVKELRRRGMGDLVIADLNGDGVLDQADMVLALQGNLPPRSVKTPRSTRSLRN